MHSIPRLSFTGLLCLGMRDGRTAGPWFRLLAGALSGLRATFHGIGIVGIGSGAAALWFGSNGLRARVLHTSPFLCASLAFSIGWLLFYLLVLTLPVAPSQETSTIDFRTLMGATVADQRVVEPLLSWSAVGEVGLTSLIVGMPVLLLALWVLGSSLTTGRTRHVLLGYAAPSVLWIIFWWPSNGTSGDLDLLFAIFPAFSAAAWIVARRDGPTWMAVALVVVSHFLVWSAIASPTLAK